ncbi:plasmid mobilization protein [Chitinophaga rhizosphaerae]|uniref:plasmid mobilization protein n=1 Tax=Chitinophaga rhizosphaerae TaxID=1864947 RepID=UPI000F8031D9|nr:plasmid mobilization relaxosome protein MobC [Chitinophaga rhizosphaerae]
MNRKKVPDNSALKFDVKTRITTAHYTRLTQQLKQSTYRTMAELLRDIICFRQVKLVTIDATMGETMERLVAIKRELNAIGNNLNQITRSLNAGKGRHTLAVVELMTLVRELSAHIDPVSAIIADLSKRWLDEEKATPSGDVDC